MSCILASLSSELILPKNCLFKTSNFPFFLMANEEIWTVHQYAHETPLLKMSHLHMNYSSDLSLPRKARLSFSLCCGHRVCFRLPGRPVSSNNICGICGAFLDCNVCWTSATLLGCDTPMQRSWFLALPNSSPHTR